jgi:hypothetical protein
LTWLGKRGVDVDVDVDFDVDFDVEVSVNVNVNVNVNVEDDVNTLKSAWIYCNAEIKISHVE